MPLSYKADIENSKQILCESQENCISEVIQVYNHCKE